MTLYDDLLPGRFCWTCGENKHPSAFSERAGEHDGLAAECRRCEECREMARAMDGETGPREYAIEGEGRPRPRPTLETALYRSAVETATRRRPRSGLMPQRVAV